MNLFDSSFLCLDIGTQFVRGVAQRVRNGRIDSAAMYSMDSFDTVYALKCVIDELERQIGTHFDSAYITGDFGEIHFDMSAKSTLWNGEHKITPNDIRAQISKIVAPENYFPMHIVPLRYDTQSARNISAPVGYTDRQLISAFGALFYPQSRLSEILSFLRRAHIQSAGFFDPQFVQNAAFRTAGQTTMFIDFGAAFTSASIWSDRGPMWYTKIPLGGNAITSEMAEKLNIDFNIANRIFQSVASMLPKEMDRFTPADTEYEFSRDDVNDIIIPMISDIVLQIQQSCAPAIEKYKPVKIIISGGGAEIESIADYVEHIFGLSVTNMHADASVRALAAYIWNCEDAHRAAYIARSERMHRINQKLGKLFHRRRSTRPRFIPIMPSTLCFNMASPVTYTMFKSGGISIIHVDIMDGLYVDRIAGSIDELKNIRAQTDAHLHVHLMTESPDIWASDAIAAGADTVILSTNTSGLRDAIRHVHSSGHRVGIAINPETPISIVKDVLRELDEVMIMGVSPGAAGQPFDPSVLNKIKVLNNTRKTYKLKLKISVDGGIDNITAQQCWNAGADLLVSGSYLAQSNDFPLAVQSLLPQNKKK